MHHDPNDLGSRSSQQNLPLAYHIIVSIILLYPLCYLTIDEDEEGDRITVRGDEELQAMINGVGHSCSVLNNV